MNFTLISSNVGLSKHAQNDHLKTTKLQKVQKYPLTSYFAYCYEIYRQIRKIPWLQSVQINFNNRIFCTTESKQPPPKKMSLSPWVIAPSPLWSKRTAPRAFFLNFSFPLRGRGLHSMSQSSNLTEGYLIKPICLSPLQFKISTCPLMLCPEN